LGRGHDSKARFKGLFLMTRFVLSSLRVVGFVAAAACALSALPAAHAATKPSLVANFGDWNVFVGEVGKGRICYTLAQPKSREPASLTRDPGYAFISDRPAEGVRNEVSFIMGFDIASGDTADSKTDARPGEKPTRSDVRSRTSVAPAPVAVVDQVSS